MHRPLGLALALLSTRIAVAAEAPVKIAVMPVQVDKSAEGQIPQLVNDVVLTAVQNLGTFEVIGQDDVNSLIGFEKQKDLLGCDDASCLADIGGALGVDKILVMKVARVGEEWVTTSKLINIRAARVEGRASEFTPGSAKALLVAMPKIVNSLFGASTSSQAAPPPTDAAQPPPFSASPDVQPAPASTPAEPERPDRRGRGLMLGLTASGAPGGTLTSEISDGTSDDMDISSSGSARFFVEYWINRFVGFGLSYNSIVATPDCGVDSCDDSTWGAVAASASGGVHIARPLKLYGRLDLGSAKMDVPDEFQTYSDTYGIDVSSGRGLYFGAAVGALWQPWRHFAFSLEIARVMASSSMTMSATGISDETIDLRLSQTQFGLGLMLVF